MNRRHDEVSTIYTGAIETAELFGRRLYTEAWERGWSRASKKVVLGDGAEWIWRPEVRMGLSTTRPIRVEIVMGITDHRCKPDREALVRGLDYTAAHRSHHSSMT